MRSTLICVFLMLIVRSQKVSKATATNEFRPTPIPLNEWHTEQRKGRAKNDYEPPSTAATGGHGRYWEDALRHSVYLTLVRDKIDKLIAQGEVISPDKKLEPYIPKDIDDHDLWEKIKSAPFDRIGADEPDTYGDVTILAKGRLLKDKDRYRFADDRNREKCYNETCMDSVKAIWSVKRVRQRDSESNAGTHHYELTFSVISQPSKNQKKPYENPIRTFTVREKQEDYNHNYTPDRSKVKPTRMMWFHKNIVPIPNYHRQSLDRIFSSLFFDDDDESPQRQYGRHPPTYGASAYNQFSKVAHVGSSAQFQHKKPLQPPYKIRTNVMKMPLHSVGQTNPTVYTPESLPSSPYPSQSKDHHMYVLPIQPANTINTNNLLTSPSPIAVPPNSIESETSKEISLNTTDFTTKATDIITVPPKYLTYSRTKAPSMKVKYYPQHIRPPVYNAPPGVFVTMDKKPFKPMPPLKLIHGKPVKTSRPLDFRPSPQVLDIQFSEPDPFSDTAFRPITVNYDNNNATTEITKTYDYGKHEDRRPNPTSRKPQKKQENIKAHKITTSAPEIITAHNEIQDIENPGWNILGALSKTTPMAAALTEKIQTTPKEEEHSITTTTSTTTTQPTSTTAKKRTTTTTTESSETTTTKVTKRTRPPPEFKNVERKERKSKRRTTTTSTKAPLISVSKLDHDLTPQASSAATSSSKLQKDSSKKPFLTTTTSTTTTITKIILPTTVTNETTTTIFNAQATNELATLASATKYSTTKSPFTKIPTTTIKSPSTADVSKINSTTIKVSTKKASRTNAATTNMTVLSSLATAKPAKSFVSKTTHKVTSKITTTSESPTTTVITQPTTVASTTQPKNKNRFRQSTLMQKGTSVNHDKWSLIPTSGEKIKSVIPVSGTFSPRRKGSNFQGYVSSTPKNSDLDDGEKHISSPYISKTSTTQIPLTVKVSSQSETYQHGENDNDSSASIVYDQILYPENDVADIDGTIDSANGPISDTDDFMYDVLPLAVLTKKKLEPVTTDESVNTTTFKPKSKGKCKNKKSQNLSTNSEQESEEANVTTTNTTSTTTSTTTTTSTLAPTTKVISTSVTAADVSKSLDVTKTTQKTKNHDIFQTLFGFNFEDEFNLNNTAEASQLDEEQSEHNVRYLDPEDEYERPFDKFEERRQVNESEYENIDYEDEKRAILDEEDDSEELKHLEIDQEDYTNFEEEEDQIDLLELMGME